MPNAGKRPLKHTLHVRRLDLTRAQAPHVLAAARDGEHPLHGKNVSCCPSLSLCPQVLAPEQEGPEEVG